MNKKAFNVAMEMPTWVVRLGILILVLIVIAAGVSIFLTRDIEVKRFESQMIMYNLYNCLSYEKHFGLIDSTKLNNLNGCFNFGNLKLNLTFRDLNNNVINEVFIDKDGYKRDFPLCKVKIENEVVTCYSSKDYVLIDNKPAVLEFNLIYPEKFEINKGVIP